MDESQVKKQIEEAVSGLPQIHLAWDANSQSVLPPVFDPKEFKTWDFVVAVLSMALDKAKFTRDMMQSEAINHQRMQAMQDSQIRARILNGGAR